MKRTTSVRSLFAIFSFILLASSFNLFAQQQVIRCYSTEYDSIRHAHNPDIQSNEDFEAWLDRLIQEKKYRAQTQHIVDGVYYIPIVVHVIHNGEAVGTGTNLSVAAIQSQIDVLNEDFRKILGSNGYNTHPDGADTQIEFCLAKRRPDGTAFPAGEDGINRINRNSVGWTAPPYSTAYIDGTIKPFTTGTQFGGWDPADYMNFWSCNISGGILGYAQFPTTVLGGMSCGAQNTSTDGVVMLYSSIGKSSVTGFPGPYNEGRTATHEIGHWLGLRHIWGDGGCGVDDFCNDTPLSDASNFGCPTTNSCADPGGDPNDMVENYMDYTDDLCMNIFTYDQKMRMRTVLENSPIRYSLINSDACTPPTTNDAAIVNITQPFGDNCAGPITPVVTLRNRGANNLTSAVINYTLNNGSATTFNWTGSIAPGAEASITLPAFTAPLGVHLFSAYPTLPNGVIDPDPTYDTTAIYFAVSNGYQPNYSQDFEAGIFPPDVRWYVDNPNGDCFEWVGGPCTSSTGNSNNVAALMTNYGNPTTQDEYLYTPYFILPCNATSASFDFDKAYRRRATGVNDRLRVEMSTDCGTSWTTIFDQAGTTLETVGTVSNTYWIPNAAGNWGAVSLDLMPYVLGTSQTVQFRFRATCAGNGGNLYVDNVAFNAVTPGEIQVDVAGVEVLDEGYYDYGAQAIGAPVTVTYTITNTGTSTLTLTPPITITGDPEFALNTSFGSTSIPAGGTTTFSITYTASGAGPFSANVSFGTNDCDESTFNFVITGTGDVVLPTALFTNTPSVVCEGGSVTYTDASSAASGWNWTFPGGSPATATGPGPHTVTYATAGTYSATLEATNAFGSDIYTNPSAVGVGSSSLSTITLLTPVNGELGTTIPTLFTWNPSPDPGVTYEIQIATDAGFAAIVDQAAGIGTTSYTSTALSSTMTYFWRVRASNACGISAWSSAFTFTTNTCATTDATDVPIAITATGTPTITSTINIPTSGTITDVNVLNLIGTHTWVSDLTVSLTSPLGTTVTLFSGVCTNLDNFDLNFDDAAASATLPCPPTGGGTYQPSGLLSDFNGEDAAGNWVLTIFDAFNQDGGSLTSWTLELCVAPAAPCNNPDIATVGGLTTICEGGTTTLSITAGNLNDATDWQWYEGSCGGTSVGSGTSITVSPTVSTSYFVRGEGGCVVPAGCQQVDVTVNPIYNSTENPVICQGDTYTYPDGTTGTVTESHTSNLSSVITGCDSIIVSNLTVNPVPATVTLTAPANGATGVALPVSFSWTIAPEPGVTYNIQIASDAGFTSIVDQASGIATTTYLSNALAPNTTYYWHVEAASTCGSAGYSSAFSFTTGSCVTIAATDVPVTISATGTPTITSVINFPYSGTITDVNVIDLVGNHTKIRDLVVTLTSPTGTVVELFNQVCNNQNDFNVDFDDAAASATLPCPPIDGNAYQPSGLLSDFNTEDPLGNWTLTIMDMANTNGGALTGWSLEVCIDPVVACTDPDVPTVTASAVTCEGEVSTLTISGNLNDATAWYIYEGSCGGTLLGSTATTTFDVTPTAPGTTYYVRGEDGAGCVNEALISCGTVTVNVNAIPSAPVVTVTDGCGSSILTATGTNLLWSTGETTASITVTAAGPYTVTQTVGGCTSASGTGNANPTAIPSAPVVTVTDGCGSSTLTATGTNLLWSTGETTPSITVSAAGPYTVTQTVGGCTSSPATGNANPTAIPSAPVVTVTDGCGSSSLTATGSNLLWSTGETTASIAVTAAGPYTVTQTVGGCTSAPATGNANPTAIPSSPVVTVTDGCGTSTLTATGTNLLWSTGETTASITVTAAGPYTVTQTVGGCTSAPATGNANPTAIPSAPVVTVTDGCGSSTLTATGTNLLWSTGETTASITVTAAGAYTVTQTVGGCTSAPGTGNANPTAAPTITLTSSNPTSCGGSEGTITVNGSGTGTVSWSGTASGSVSGQTLPYTITGLGSGPYTVSFDNGCLSNTPSVSLSDPGAPSAPVVTVTDGCGSSILTATGSNLLWSTGETTASITVTAAGPYTVTQTVGGCTSAPGTGNANPTAIPSAPVVTVTDGCGSSTLTATGTNLLWSTGETTASITVTAAGPYTVTQTVGGCTSAPGTGNANPIAIPSAPVVTVTDGCGSSTLTATGTNLLWSTGETTASITVTAAGAYTVTQTVGGCTSAPGTGNANPTASPTITLTSSNPTSCGGSEGTITVNGSGTGTVSWSGTASGSVTGQSLPYTITGLSAGPYTVSFDNGCLSNTPSVSLSDPGAPSAPVVTVTDGCGSSTLTATGTNLLWSTGETTASITVTAAGPYTVTQTVGGCTSTAATGNANPTAIPSAPVVTVTDGCGSSTLTATGTNLLWSTGETTASITVTAAGPYTVTQTVGGCTSAPATENANPTAIPSAPVVTVTDGCGSSTLTATGSNLLWSTGETTASITVTAAGPYTVTQTVGGCTSAPATGNANPTAIPSAPVVTVTDGCGASTLTATGTSLLWSTGETTASITVTAAGPYTVTQTVGGCTSAPATGNANPTAIPSAPVVTVTDGCGSSTLTATGTNLLWSTGETTASITVTAAGPYTVTQTVGGCTSAPGTGNSNPIATPSAPVVTVTDGCGSSTLTATGTNLLWSTGETTASITVASAGTYTVTQTVGACTSLAGSGIAAPQSIPSAPVVTVNNYCGYSDLTASGTNLLWSTGETTATINVTSGGTYYVSQSAGSCVSPTTSVTAVPLLVPAAPAITATGTTTFCEGDSVELSVSQTTGVLWSTGETTSAVMIYSSGNYNVTYTAANGCESPSSSMTVVVNPLPVVTLGAFADVCAGSDPFTLTGGNPSGGVFSGPGVTGGVLDPAVAGAGIHTITYTYTDGNACSNSAQSTINISDCAGITELELNGISIYPNPATDQITLKSNKYLVELVKLYDAAGRLVRELQPSQMSFDVDLTELEPAMYHVVITIENGQSFRSKIMKQ